MVIIGYNMTHIGYKLGKKAATVILSTGILQRVITFFAVLGLFMLGGLTSSFVNIQTPLVITVNDAVIGVQTGILDAVLPGILSVITVWAIYEYLRKGKGNVMLKATLALAAIGLVCGALGILGTPA